MSWVVLGEEAYTYEVVPGWGHLPPDVRFGYTHGVVVDAEDNVYVHNQSKDAVAVFDRSGRFLGSWGEDFAASAHGMFLSREGAHEYLYLTDPQRQMVVKATLRGDILFRLGTPDVPEAYPSPDLYHPTDACVAPNGDIYVCDGYGEGWVHQYGADGAHIRSWGGKGSAPGRMDCPHGIWVDTRGPAPRLLVADRGNRRLQVFTLEGQHTGFIEGELRLPCCMYQFGQDLYIPDLHGRVTILGPDDRAVTHLGDNPGVWELPGWPNIPHSQRVVGRFVSPHAVCVDSHGDIYVVEWVADGRLTKLRRRR